MDNQHTEPDNIWPPPPSDRSEPQSIAPQEIQPKQSFKVYVVLLVTLGLVSGVIDACDKSNLNLFGKYSLYVAAFTLGIAYPRRVIISAIGLVFCLYVVHVSAILCGVKPPYVEEDVPSALYSFIELPQTCLWALIGAGLGIAYRFIQPRDE